MDYRASLTIDYNNPHDNNARNRLWKALEHAGWAYAETSAMYIETDDITAVLRAFEVLARGAGLPGTLSALNVNVQLVNAKKATPGSQTPANSYAAVMLAPLPPQLP